MLTLCLRQVLGRICGRGASLAIDERGVAAVEFGMLVPLLFIMFVGTLELGQAVGLDRRISMATSATANLITRDKTATDASLDATMDIVKHLLKPYDPDRMKVSIISVRARDNPTDTFVAWSKAYNGATAPTKCSSYTMPAGLLSANGSVIVVESQYAYEPLIISHYLEGGINLQDKSTMAPRANACVRFNDEDCNCP